MNTHQGFTLIEVLFSLFLISSTSIWLLNQQSHITHLLYQASIKSEVLRRLDNHAETFLVKKKAGFTSIQFLGNESW